MNGNFLDHDQNVFIVDASCAKRIRFICYLNKLSISVSLFQKMIVSLLRGATVSSSKEEHDSNPRKLNFLRSVGALTAQGTMSSNLNKFEHVMGGGELYRGRPGSRTLYRERSWDTAQEPPPRGQTDTTENVTFATPLAAAIMHDRFRFWIYDKRKFYSIRCIGHKARWLYNLRCTWGSLHQNILYAFYQLQSASMLTLPVTLFKQTKAPYSHIAVNVIEKNTSLSRSVNGP